jgi:hypothetical protein
MIKTFLLFAAIAAGAVGAPLPLLDSASIDGVTWTFAKPSPVGRFVNGQLYVVGPVTITAITPEPANGRNGSVLNLPPDPNISGFDDRVRGDRFRERLRVYPPVKMKPGDALLSSISVNTVGAARTWLQESVPTASPVGSVSILTCLAAPVDADAFRPSYTDRRQKIYYADSLRRNLLPNLKMWRSGTPDINLFAEHFRRPWLDVCFFGFDAAVDYQPDYGREVARAVGIASLLLCMDFTPAEKEPLLVNFVQYGIDLWGIAGAGFPGWPARGGNGSGRKWPIIFAGLLLGDTAMASPNTMYPNLRFGEDMQTMPGRSWTGATVVYTGQAGVIAGKRVSPRPGWGPYEDRPPSAWGDSDKIGEDDRRCCTSLGWVAEALSAHLLGAEKLWNHDAFFDYVDRWMTEDDSRAIAEIKQVKGWDYSASWERQRQTWDEFVQNMWEVYRFSGNR